MRGNRWEYFEVGMKKAEWLGKPDGMLLSWTNESGLHLTIFFNQPTNSEVEAIRAGSRFEVAFRDINGVGFFGFKFGDLPWGDCVFSPNIYDTEHKPVFDEPAKGKTYALHIMLIDTYKGEVKALRSIALGKEFADHFRSWGNESLKRNMARFTYNRIVDKVFNDFPNPESLFATADARWVLSHGATMPTLSVEEKE